MEKTETKETTKATVVTLLARAFGLPVAGINLEERLGKKAYINSLGLDCAWKRWPDVLKIVRITRLSVYKEIGDVALTEIEAEDKMGGRRGALGSASAANMVLIKGYPNELCETRAMNRLLRRALLPYLYEEYEKNIANMTQEERTMLAEYVSDFGRVSAEEMPTEGEGDQTQQMTLITNEEMAQIKPYLERILAAESEEGLEGVGIAIKEKTLELTSQQITKLKDAYRNRKAAIQKKSTVPKSDKETEDKGAS